MYLYYSVGSTVASSSSLTSYTAGATLTVPVGTSYFMYGFNGGTSSLTFTLTFTGTSMSSYNDRCILCLLTSSTYWFCTAEDICYNSAPTCASKTQNLFNCNPQTLQVGQVEMTDSMIGSAYTYNQAVAADSYSYVQIMNSMTA